MEFKILRKSKKSRARLGIIKTPHGILHTPAFFPVATKACLKTLDSCDIKNIGFEGVLCNTYHLMLQPGSRVIKKQGGLHKFMNFDGVIATDSGGFQVFSLGKAIEQGVGKIAKIFPGKKPLSMQKNKPSDYSCDRKNSQMVKITEDGVYFRSHLDGSQHFLGPEKSIQIQHDLGSDIMFAFDECTSPLDGFDYTQKAMERTHRWAIRCLQQQKLKVKSSRLRQDFGGQAKLKVKEPAFAPSFAKATAGKKAMAGKQGLFGIIQGGEYKRLREQSAKFIGNLDFDGFGIGGSLGKTKERMYEILHWTIPLLPSEKPRHLLGIGYLEDFEPSIKSGVDLFDCVYPTRLARHGVALTAKEKLNLNQTKFLTDKNPIDKKCACPTCQNHSRAYISHLFRAKEITAMRLLTMHNLWFFKQFIDKIRQKIAAGKL